ncbi:hypothetical protein K9F62_11040 [Desulfovibrio sp. JY]|nr:hypothetical protein K9F62_11040 [Desulfovibrio sp. JY]
MLCKIILFLSLFLLALHQSVNHAWCYNDEITLFIDRFSPKNDLPKETAKILSNKIATILQLKILSSFQKQKTEKVNEFGHGRIKPNYEEPCINDLAGAIEVAQNPRNLYQFVLYGSFYKFKDGVILQSYLAIPFFAKLKDGNFSDYRNQHREDWCIKIYKKTALEKICIGLPNRYYSLPLIFISNDMLKHYEKLWETPIYSETKTVMVGKLEPPYRFISRSGNWMKVKTKSVIGFINIEDISRFDDKVIYFISGLISYFRGDFEQCTKYMSKFIDEQTDGNSMRQDAMLYLIAAKSRLNKKNTENETNLAIEANPFSQKAYEYVAFATFSGPQNLHQSINFFCNNKYYKLYKQNTAGLNLFSGLCESE